MIENSTKIPQRCGICNYLTELPAPTRGATLFACSHRKAFDDNQVPLFVMPSEPPPDFCPFVQQQTKTIASKLNTLLNRLEKR